jgi:hypothetical protein
MTTPEPLQAVGSSADEWTREVVPRLPSSVEEQAKALGAFERSRQIRCATDLLRGVLAYVYSVHSFQHLSIWSVLVGLADVSANDWRKRLRQASAWLIDGTHFKCPGPLGMVWRVHTAFDLLTGRMSQREA